jgi:D-alanyl-D-alanine carboxypeptidase
MMTLYIAFEAAERGEISLDAVATVSANAAAEPGSRLGLRAGQRIALRHLVRATAVKSANDAATALAEAISGSEPAFVERMNATARRLGLAGTTFRNAHGLTAEGHLTTARDMSRLGRHLLFDHPDYYNLFSRLEADAGVARVRHTNRRFLTSYEGADGIKTGYTRAAGFNLTASAVKGDKRLIVTVFGAPSSAARAAQVAELMEAAFARVPESVPARPPASAMVAQLPATTGSLFAPPATAPSRTRETRPESGVGGVIALGSVGLGGLGKGAGAIR